MQRFWRQNTESKISVFAGTPSQNPASYGVVKTRVEKHQRTDLAAHPAAPAKALERSIETHVVVAAGASVRPSS